MTEAKESPNERAADIAAGPGRDRPRAAGPAAPRRSRRRTTTTRRRSARSSSTAPRARWSAPARSSRTRRTRASPTWCGRRATACTPGQRAAGTATSPSSRPTTTRGCPRRGSAARPSREAGPVRRVVGATGHRPPTSGSPPARRRGGSGSPYDFAVLHVPPENGGGKSLEETVGAALPVWFNAPSPTEVSSLGAWGYPAAPPFDGQKMFECIGPARPAVAGRRPADGVPDRLHDDRWLLWRRLVRQGAGRRGGAGLQHLDRPAVTATWLAGPHLGAAAEGVYRRDEPEVLERVTPYRGGAWRRRGRGTAKARPRDVGAGLRVRGPTARRVPGPARSAMRRPGRTAPVPRPGPRAPGP